MPRRTAGRAGRRAGARNIGRWLSAICLAIQTCSALKAAGVDVPNVRYASAGFVWFCGVGLCLGAFRKSFVLVRFYKGFEGFPFLRLLIPISDLYFLRFRYLVLINYWSQHAIHFVLF